MKNLIMRKSMTLAIVASLVAGCFVGCGNASPSSDESKDGISIVTTIFPEYDWVRQITAGNDKVDITMLLDNGVDLHSYQPTADDIMKIATCDVFIYVGGESDEWVEDALKEAINPDMQVINLLDTLGNSAKEEEIVEGMEAVEEHDHSEEVSTFEKMSEENGDEKHEEEETEYDEHVWLSLKNSELLVDEIANAISIVDEANASLYEENAAAYVKELDSLDKQYADAVANANVNTVLFGDRFPFRYMVDDYNLDYYAAFVGCSAETEASFETITFLAGKVDELGLNTVLTIENSDEKIAKTIIENTKAKDAKILSMNSMQSTTSDDVTAGATYLSIMEENLKVLTDALK